MSFNNIEISKDSFFLLTKPKNYIGIVYLVNHIFFLFIFGLLTIFIYDYSIIFSLLSYLIYCQIFNFLSTTGAMHEFAHGKVFTNKKINNFIYNILGYLTWTNPSFYKATHFNHHKNLCHVEDLECFKQSDFKKLKSSEVIFFIVPSLKLFFFRIYFNLCTMIGKIKDDRLRKIFENSNKFKIKFDAFFILFFHIVIIFFSLFSSSILPLIFLSFPTFFSRYLSYVLARSQHNISQKEIEKSELLNSNLKNKNYENEPNRNLRNSVSIRLPKILELLYWNMNYHSEHHLLPSVPCYNLKYIQSEIKISKKLSEIYNIRNFYEEMKRHH